MTAVYDQLNAKGYEIINTVGGYEESEKLRNLYGPSRKHDWEPVLVQRDRPTRRGACKEADLPYTLSALVMRPRAVEALQDILETHGEVLPLATTDGVELYVFNPRFVLDALDMKRSELEYASPTSPFGVCKYVFIEKVIRDVAIFRLPQAYLHTFFTDRFVERVKKAKLKGTEFIKLWSSDE
jgi:hypothetical protein